MITRVSNRYVSGPFHPSPIKPKHPNDAIIFLVNRSTHPNPPRTRGGSVSLVCRPGALQFEQGGYEDSKARLRGTLVKDGFRMAQMAVRPGHVTSK
jgi:hypothetical protein